MKGLEEILENRAIDAWVKRFRRATHQVNRPHQCDAEIIELPGDADRYLAVTIDTVAEEIGVGLYRDPYTMGWVAIMACLSDLAAVGADLLGVVISVCLEPSRSGAFIDEIARGMQDACHVLSTSVLGGDTNAAPTIALSACGLGLVPQTAFMTRLGCQPGDALFLSGGVGQGNALGLVRLSGIPDESFPEERYRPVAALKEGRVIREYTGCCMDTSDGLLATLDQLVRLNGTGFFIDCNWSRLLTPEVFRLCSQTGAPPWTMIAGPHGEFRLLFAIPQRRTDEFLKRCQNEGMVPIRLGKVQEEPAITLGLPTGRAVHVDAAPLRNLWAGVMVEPQRYIEQFRAFGKTWGLE